MANYPVPVAHRMAYDRDGTSVYKISGTTSILLTQANLIQLNNESFNSASYGGYYITFLFPEFRDLKGLLVNNRELVSNIQTSVDTTNGTDGTWVTYLDNTNVSYNNSTAFRTSVRYADALGVKALRMLSSGSAGNVVYNIHIYGHKSSGQSLDALAVWDPVLDQRADPAVFDFGDLMQTGQKVKTFRIKNLSATKTANSVTVGLEALTDTTPSFLGMHSLSSDGVNYASSLSLGNLAPGAISGVLNLREKLTADAVLSTWYARVFSEAASWS